MSRISRGTPAGDAYLDLKTQARGSGRPSDELIQLYLLECFLGSPGHQLDAGQAGPQGRRPPGDVGRWSHDDQSTIRSDFSTEVTSRIRYLRIRVPFFTSKALEFAADVGHDANLAVPRPSSLRCRNMSLLFDSRASE